MVFLVAPWGNMLYCNRWYIHWPASHRSPVFMSVLCFKKMELLWRIPIPDCCWKLHIVTVTSTILLLMPYKFPQFLNIQTKKFWPKIRSAMPELGVLFWDIQRWYPEPVQADSSSYDIPVYPFPPIHSCKILKFLFPPASYILTDSSSLGRRWRSDVTRNDVTLVFLPELWKADIFLEISLEVPTQTWAEACVIFSTWHPSGCLGLKETGISQDQSGYLLIPWSWE